MDSHSLRHQALHLRKNRASIIGAIEYMVSQCLTRNQSGLDELTQFALDRPECDSCQSRKLAQVERIAHMPVENGEQSTAGASEEGPGKHADCTHFGVNRTRNGYTQSRVAVGDVRANSVKRVASAVGEGAIAVSRVYRALAEL